MPVGPVRGIPPFRVAEEAASCWDLGTAGPQDDRSMGVHSWLCTLTSKDAVVLWVFMIPSLHVLFVSVSALVELAVAHLHKKHAACSK